MLKVMLWLDCTVHWNTLLTPLDPCVKMWASEHAQVITPDSVKKKPVNGTSICLACSMSLAALCRQE